MKKITALLLALCMLLAITPVLAEEGPGGNWYMSLADVTLGYILLNEDGTAIVNVASQEDIAGTWTADGNTVTISDVAGEKTMYEYELDIPECDRPVQVSIMHWDWHQVTRFDCELYLTQTENGVKAEYNLNSKASNLSVFEGQKSSNSFSEYEDITISVKI